MQRTMDVVKENLQTVFFDGDDPADRKRLVDPQTLGTQTQEAQDQPQEGQHQNPDCERREPAAAGLFHGVVSLHAPTLARCPACRQQQKNRNAAAG